MTSARVVTTAVVAPLGTVAVVANSFGITVESLCYMPTYGMQHAASTLVGQSVGARRKDLVYRLRRCTKGYTIATPVAQTVGAERSPIIRRKPHNPKRGVCRRKMRTIFPESIYSLVWMSCPLPPRQTI